MFSVTRRAGRGAPEERDGGVVFRAAHRRVSAALRQPPAVLSFCQNALRALATLGATTPTQYGAEGLCVK